MAVGETFGLRHGADDAWAPREIQHRSCCRWAISGFGAAEEVAPASVSGLRISPLGACQAGRFRLKCGPFSHRFTVANETPICLREPCLREFKAPRPHGPNTTRIVGGDVDR